MSNREHSRNPFRPVLPGLEVVIARWLIPAYFAGVILPAFGALWMHLTRPPGSLDMAQEKSLQVVDLMAVGLALFDATFVFTVALGCLIVTLMKARPRYADSMRPPAA